MQSFSANIHSVESSSRRKHEEEIYEELCYVTLRLGRDRDKSLGVIPLEPIEKRDYCVKELVETEKNYCDALNMIVTHFIQPLSKILRTNDRKTIFGQIKYLYDIHWGFYTELCRSCQANSPAIGQTCAQSGGDSSGGTVLVNNCNYNNINTNNNLNNFMISNCFIKFKDKFVVYGQYCANLPKAQTMIDDLCSRDELIGQAVDKCQMKANDGKFKLRDLLSLPMQRILKYHLLLSQLIKTTVETHEDYSGLQKAHQSMVDLGQYINEVKRDTETLEIIADIQSSIVDLEMPENTELKDYGRLLKDGELKIRSHDETRLKNRYVFVFDKVMLMCKSIRGEQYSYKEALILADYQVIEDQSIASTISKLTKQWSNGWNLVHRQNKTTYTFFTKSEDMKKKWMEAIDKALDNVCPLACREGSTDHTFAMFTFPTPTTCADCEQLLRGTFFQGYQCTVCNVAVHKNCISTVRSCGAPSLPPRPPLPPSSPGVSLNSFSGDEDNVRNSASDLRRINGVSSGRTHARALSDYSGDSTSGELSFIAEDIILITNKSPKLCEDSPEIWWEGRNTRTSCEGIFPSALVKEVDLSNEVNGRQSYEDPNFICGVYSAQQSDDSTLCLEEYPWFGGSMDRESAHSTLEHMPTGAFLVRISPKQKGSYAISLNYSGTVKHMRVQRTRDHHYLYLSESRYFKTIIDLVKWYSDNSLCESFNLVNTNLLIPYKKALSAEPVSYAIALYSFTGSSSNLLDLKKGDRVAILSKAGESKGWWKGQIQQRIGYFPLAYVTQINDIL